MAIDKQNTPPPINKPMVGENGHGTVEFIRYLEDMQSSAIATTAVIVPVGGIIMFSGLLEDLPESWAFCDGTNDTPDLTAKFIMASSDGTSGEEGGRSDTAIPSHTHTITHNHPSVNTSGTDNAKGDQTIRYWQGGTVSASGGGIVIPDYPNGINAGSSGWHRHSVELPQYTGDSGSTGEEDVTTSNLPPYYTLAYIMRIK